MTDLNELLDMDFAPAWYHNEFDKLIGDVVDIDERDAGYGPYPIITVRVTQTPTPVNLKEGQAKIGDLVAWHARGTVAQNEARDVQRGQSIGIKRMGDKANPKGGKDMQIWRVKTVGGTAPVSTTAPELDNDGPSADDLI